MSKDPSRAACNGSPMKRVKIATFKHNATILLGSTTPEVDLTAAPDP